MKNKQVRKKGNILEKVSSKKSFEKFFYFASLLTLFLTTIYWSILGAKVQSFNSDQLADPYLLKSWSTLKSASFPGVHSFLLKWPILWLISVFNFSPALYYLFTVLLCLVTVGFLAYLLARVEKRKLVLGTIFFSLASILLMIPAQVYPGALLPANMAMITTRNIEYVVFIVSVMYAIKAKKLFSKESIFAAILFGLLISSDKLFVTLGIGGAIIGLIYFVAINRWKIAAKYNVLLIVTVVGGVLGTLLLLVIRSLHLTHITSAANTSYYGASSGLKSIITAVVYSFMGLLSNFGANPASGTLIAREIPRSYLTNLFGVGLIPYLFNLFILIVCVYLAIRLVISLTRNKHNVGDKYTLLAIFLLASTLVAFLVFVVSNHYYPVDSRYLAISLFALMLCSVVYLKDWSLKKGWVVTVGLIAVISCCFGLFSSYSSYSKDLNAMKNVNNRNQIIASDLKERVVTYLIGDYWRVVPIKSLDQNVKIIAESGCNQEYSNLASVSTLGSIKHQSFAYILTFQGSLTGYKGCSINQVVSLYGKPNSSELIAGSLEHPKELLLFYQRGIRKSAPKLANSTLATILPIPLSQLPNVNCSGPTSMNIVAHQDDDLLFMNPDIMNDIASGKCVRTVYITAGDDGQGENYWLSRQVGVENAYSTMIGKEMIWIKRIVKLANNEFINVANPRGNPNISLIFFDLPDGNLRGQGFKATGYQSLAKLYRGEIKNIDSVDGQSTYSLSQLEDAIEQLFYTYKPTLIRTQANYISSIYPDHSDHMTVGSIVKISYALYERDQFQNQVIIPIQFYIGYPIHAFPANVSGPALLKKEEVFLAYSKYDPGTCSTIVQCNTTPTYGSYLAREYQNPY